MDLKRTVVSSSPENRRRRPAIPSLLFVGLVLVYGSLSPGAIHSMGYGDEEVRAANALVDAVGAWVRLDPASLAPAVTRHGILGVVVELPFAAAGRLLAVFQPVLAEAPLALLPILATSLIVLIVFVWTRELTGSAGDAFLLAMAAGFATMLWPYAYLGMETTQSLALLAAAYLALHRENRIVLFAVAAGFALSLKSTGLFLLPAVAYLFREQLLRVQAGAERRKAAFVIAAIVVGLRTANSVAMAFYMRPASMAVKFGDLVDLQPLALATRLLGFLASPNKGLLIYAPVAVLALFRFCDTRCRRGEEAAFALWTLAGLALGFSLLVIWSEETWGPRYLHSAVAPLVVALGACRVPQKETRKNRRSLAAALLVAAMTLGFAVNALGVAVYYGTLHVAMTAAGENTLDAIQSDPAWNPVHFHAWVLKEWLRDPVHASARPHRFVIVRRWWIRPPAEVMPTTVDVGPLVRPQPFLLRFWHAAPGALDQLPRILAVALLAGVGLLAWCGVAAAREPRRIQAGDLIA